MPHRVCPWWLGYLLATPVRRLFQDPREVLSPYVREGMTVLEPGPGMGFFTLELARLVGPSGHVLAVDIQPRMLAALKRRATRAGLLDRIDIRVVSPDTLGLAELAGSVDFTPAIAVVHELPNVERFFTEVAMVSKLGAGLLIAEPTGHVKTADFEAQLQAAAHAGFTLQARPSIRRSHAAFLRKV
jgi:ubiquinone/menaquinone biosynthesis C-methylase UbiE